jgi:protein tyrosine phosphatase (PTP) superfamily phosphohydrolase (DUF442 family)
MNMHYLTGLALVLGVLSVTVPAALAQAGVEAQLEEITNYTRISDSLASSGQIGYDQVQALKEAGFEVVVNLAPASDAANGLEGFLVVEQGMSYVHIPVSWQEPSMRDLDFFFTVMEANKDRKIFVHCFANMRASAFVYLYRTLHEGVSEEQAREDMARIWDPMGQAQWAHLIEAAGEKYGSE